VVTAIGRQRFVQSIVNRVRAFDGSDKTAAANETQDYGENHLSYVRKRTEGL
jgi:hypothetical protein